MTSPAEVVTVLAVPPGPDTTFDLVDPPMATMGLVGLTDPELTVLDFVVPMLGLTDPEVVVLGFVDPGLDVCAPPPGISEGVKKSSLFCKILLNLRKDDEVLFVLALLAILRIIV